MTTDKEKWITIQVPVGTFIVTPADRENQWKHWEAVLAIVALEEGEVQAQLTESLLKLLQESFVIGSAYTMAVQEESEFGLGGRQK